MEEEKSSKREKILSLTSRLRELSEEDKSVQRNDDSTKKIITDLNLPYKIFQNFYKAIENSSQADLRKSLYKNAVRYAKLRADWFLVDREQREIMHDERRSAHNVFIDTCNIMSRNMIKNGEDAAWRKELGDDRKVNGDFGCYINFVLRFISR